MSDRHYSAAFADAAAGSAGGNRGGPRRDRGRGTGAGEPGTIFALGLPFPVHRPPCPLFPVHRPAPFPVPRSPNSPPWNGPDDERVDVLDEKAVAGDGPGGPRRPSRPPGSVALPRALRRRVAPRSAPRSSCPPAATGPLRGATRCRLRGPRHPEGGAGGGVEREELSPIAVREPDDAAADDRRRAHVHRHLLVVPHAARSRTPRPFARRAPRWCRSRGPSTPRRRSRAAA
jgi:hypothetical protein